MSPIVEMAICRIHVIMQIYTLDSTGQWVYTGNICNLRVKHEHWVSTLPRRATDTSMLLISRRVVRTQLGHATKEGPEGEPSTGAKETPKEVSGLRAAGARRRVRNMKPFKASCDEILGALQAAYLYHHKAYAASTWSSPRKMS